MSIRTKLYDKGRLVEEQMIRFLIKIDERITALEDGEGGSSEPYDDTAIKNRCKALEDAIGDEETANSILGRIKALEDG